METKTRYIFSASTEGVVLNVRAQPKSSRSGVEGVLGDAIKVRIKAAPVDGKANRELVEIIADALGVAKSRVTLKSGESSKTKRVLVKGVDELWILQKLSSII